MLEGMAGAVGFAMHEDRLAKAMQNLRLSEAEQLRNGPRTGDGLVRDAIAQGLIALAMRVAPGVVNRGAVTA
jgi:hypothetical protein